MKEKKKSFKFQHPNNSFIISFLINSYTMKNILIIPISLITICLSCGTKNDKPSTNNDTLKSSNENLSKEIKKAEAPYNFMDKVSGTYNRLTKANDEYIPKKAIVKISGKSIIIDYEKYSYDIVYKKNDTIIRFSATSEESGDFLGGGQIIINGNKVLYKMFSGPEAQEEYIYSKK